MRSAVFVFLGLTWVVPRPVVAQVSFEFLPYGAGVYFPTQKLLDHYNSVSLKQKTQVAVGGRLTLWWTSRVGAEVSVGWSPSGVSTVGAQPPESSAHVTTASVRVLRRMSPEGSPWLLRLGGGLGYVSRGGAAYNDTDGSPGVCGTSRFAGVVSAGAAHKFGHRLVLRLDAEDYMYSSGLYVHGESPGCGPSGSPYAGSGVYQCRGLGQVCDFFESAGPTGGAPYRFQNDLVLSFGLALVMRD